MQLRKHRVLFCGSQLCAVASFDSRRLELVWLKAEVRKRRSVRAVGRALAELSELVDLKRLHLVSNLFEPGFNLGSNFSFLLSEFKPGFNMVDSNFWKSSSCSRV